MKSYFGFGGAADVAHGAAGQHPAGASDAAQQAAGQIAKGNTQVTQDQVKALFQQAVNRGGSADLQAALQETGVDPTTATRIAANIAKAVGTDQDNMEQNIKHMTATGDWKGIVDSINQGGGLPKNIASNLGAPTDLAPSPAGPQAAATMNQYASQVDAHNAAGAAGQAVKESSYKSYMKKLI
jgi:hypothetical protein